MFNNRRAMACTCRKKDALSEDQENDENNGRGNRLHDSPQKL